MNWRERFPGVEMTTRTNDFGMYFEARYATRSTTVARLADIERDEHLRRGTAARRLDACARGAALAVMRQAAVDVLRLVKPDWSGFWGIGMLIDTAGGQHGRLTRVNYLDKWFDVAWDHQQDAEQVPMADAILLVLRGEWRLP